MRNCSKNTIIWLLLTFLLPITACGKLICHWEFEGNLDDSCGGKYTPRQVGNISYNQGVIGKCLDLTADGKNAVIIMGTEKVADELGKFTISLWYKGNTADNEYWAPIVSKGGEDKSGWQLRYNGSEGGGCITARGLEKTSGNCTGYGPIGDGQWHHILGVYNGKLLQLYLDGMLEESADAAGNVGSSDSPIVIGAKIAGENKMPRCFLKGLVDDIRIYDEALSYEQIQQLADYDKFLGDKFMDTYKKLNVYPIQFHRGGGMGQPENTIETLEWTWGKRAIPEADVRMTKDNVIVCFHDTDIDRLAPNAPAELKGKDIGQLTINEVKKLDVGEFRGKPGEKIPKLEEVFKAMSKSPDRFLYLDYKKIDMQRLADMVKKYGIEEQVIFTSKSHWLIRKWKSYVPQAPTMMWIGGSQNTIAARMEYLRKVNFCDITTIQFHYKSFEDGTGNLSDEFITNSKKEIESRGITFQVLPWGTSDTRVFKKLLSLGIRSFATDYPESLLPVYEEVVNTEKPEKCCSLKKSCTKK